VGVKNLTGPIGSTYFSGWQTPLSTGTIVSSTFNFSGLSGGGLYIGSEDFIISWTVNCANDVVYEKISNHVPIPPTMLLLGSGLIGLIGIRRRFKKG